ncbi:hypothetical protein FQU75_00235 [Paenibacillus polymyxa]|nr:hypothetical protein FQU75_00235 [Paenibacillus polymyxa]
MKSVIKVRVGKSSNYKVYVDGEYIATVGKVGKFWMTADSRAGFSRELAFKTLDGAAQYHAH